MEMRKIEPRSLLWEDNRVDWREHPLPWGDKWGWHRGRYVALEVNNAKFNVVSLPFGQSSPPHSSGWDHMVFVLKGEVEFTVGPDRKRFKLGKFDALCHGANTMYEYANVGQEDALFLGIACRVGDGDWPTHSTYYLPGEDKPYMHRLP